MSRVCLCFTPGFNSAIIQPCLFSGDAPYFSCATQRAGVYVCVPPFCGGLFPSLDSAIIDSSSHPFASILITSIVKNNLILDALSGLQETMSMEWLGILYKPVLDLQLHWAETMHLPHLLYETLWIKLILHAFGKVTLMHPAPEAEWMYLDCKRYLLSLHKHTLHKPQFRIFPLPRWSSVCTLNNTCKFLIDMQF